MNTMGNIFGTFLTIALAAAVFAVVGAAPALAQLHADEGIGVYKQTEVYRMGDFNLNGRFDMVDHLDMMGIFLSVGYPDPYDKRAMDFAEDGVFDVGDMVEHLEQAWPPGRWEEQAKWKWVGDYPYNESNPEMVPAKNIWRIDKSDGDKEYCYVEIRVIDRTSLQPVANPFIKIGGDPAEMGDDLGVYQTEVEHGTEDLSLQVDDDDDPNSIGSYFAIDTHLNVPFNSVVVVPLIRYVETTTSQEFDNTKDMAEAFYVEGSDILIDKNEANDGYAPWSVPPVGFQLDDHFIKDPNGAYVQVDLNLDDMMPNIGLFGIIEGEFQGDEFTPLQIEKLNKKMADINYWVVEDILPYLNPSEKETMLRKPLFLRRDASTKTTPLMRYEGRVIYPDQLNFNKATRYFGNIFFGEVRFDVYTTLEHNTMDHEIMNSLIGVEFEWEQPNDSGSCASQSGRTLTQDDKHVIQIGYTPNHYNGLDGKGINPMKQGYFARIINE